jgi:hypothetical protein
VKRVKGAYGVLLVSASEIDQRCTLKQKLNDEENVSAVDGVGQMVGLFEKNR